ncbi:MAG: zinc-finger domain-containing protein [Rhodanobacter sp.]|nr:MAG: zinc-finger domain-containing protein [Rhodanobacter sp.]
MDIDPRLPTPPDAVTGLRVSSADTVCEVDWADLPLTCPPHDSSLWNGHPRIYLPIHQTGRARCPYCGTLYLLREVQLDAVPPRLANLEIEQCYAMAIERRVRELAQK